MSRVSRITMQYWLAVRIPKSWGTSMVNFEQVAPPWLTKSDLMNYTPVAAW